MTLIFSELKKLKKHEFNYFQAYKNSENMDLIFCEPKKLKKHEFIFVFSKLVNTQKRRGFHFCKLKQAQKT